VDSPIGDSESKFFLTFHRLLLVFFKYFELLFTFYAFISHIC